MKRSRVIAGWVALVLLVAGSLLWIYRDRALDWLATGIGDAPPPAEVSPELARHTEERLRAFAAGEGPDSVALGTPAIQSLLRYRGNGLLPAGIRDPEVYLTDSTAVLAGILQVEELATARADQLRNVLGDTAAVRAEVVPTVARPGTGRIRIRTLEAGGLTVPDFLIATILRQAGLPTEDGHPRAVAFRVPPELASVAVRDSQLVLLRSLRPGAAR